MTEDFSDIENAIESGDSDYIYGESSQRIVKSKLFAMACDKGDVEVIRAFLQHGIDVKEPSWVYGFPFEAACHQGDTEVVSFLLLNGCDVNPEKGRHAGMWIPSSPLCRATHSNKQSVVKLLLENGADQNFRCHNDTHSPLYYAVENSDEAIVDLLLEYKPDFKWIKNRIAISLASRIGNKSILEKLLIASNINIKMKTVNSFHSIHGPKSPLQEATEHENFDCVEVLIKHGANPNVASGEQAITPLIYAIKNGNLQILKFLLGHGGKFTASIDEFNSDISASVYARNQGHLEKFAKESGSPEMIEFVSDIVKGLYPNKVKPSILSAFIARLRG
ncbi:ankyrin repeat domain-containing protein [Oceanicoccus sp. KOV_DT_Chl]|uniref:ankyrin repeat domain-containing protein n=1 Tax=Oceanicoccus sp. KOV_DT_Chl TaxID=1904639 RepID=UPI000C7CCAD0|nr:ankyrin repeat domain-containing protein [Oceanicoccus sp. KOV_DT_Chl]